MAKTYDLTCGALSSKGSKGDVKEGRVRFRVLCYSHYIGFGVSCWLEFTVLKFRKCENPK